MSVVYTFYAIKMHNNLFSSVNKNLVLKDSLRAKEITNRSEKKVFSIHFLFI